MHIYIFFVAVLMNYGFSNIYTRTHTINIMFQVFSLFSIPVHIFLMVWTAVWLFAKWQRNIDRELRGGPTASDTAELDPDQQDID